MTNSIQDMQQANTIFVTGSNTTESHPVIGAQIKRAVRNGAKLIVADPREIPLAKEADIFLQIRPGTSIALHNAMIHVILEENLQDDEYISTNTENFEALAESVKKYTPEYAAEICGLNPAEIREAARLYAGVDKAAIMYCMGITQHVNGTETVISLSNLALVTGNIGKAGAGLNPLRGQNNVQGACDMGALPNVFTGYQPVSNPGAVEKFEKAWGVTLSDKAGLTVTEAFNAIDEDRVKMLYIFGENPMISDPDTHHAEKALKKSFLVVQDLFLTETAELADVVLPAASFAEKDGTFVNTERRVQRVRKAVNPPGEAKADWVVFMEIMNRLGYDKQYSDVEEIFEEIRTVTPQYAGISYDRINNRGIQWPCPTEEHPGTPVLHIGKPARGAGLLKPVEFVESMELGDDAYPLVLTTGRILYHYHTMSMTNKTEGLNQIAPEVYVEINPELAAARGIENGDMVTITSRRGDVTMKAMLTDRVDNDVLFIPFHWASGANVLTNGDVLDQYCKIPGLKVTGVNLEKVAQ
jgi:formate dehydrogenase alpha subunit